MFRLLACARKSIVSINGSHKTITEIVEKNNISGSAANSPVGRIPQPRPGQT